jgi:hypothetical protein
LPTAANPSRSDRHIGRLGELLHGGGGVAAPEVEALGSAKDLAPAVRALRRSVREVGARRLQKDSILYRGLNTAVLAGFTVAWVALAVAVLSR